MTMKAREFHVQKNHPDLLGEVPVDQWIALLKKKLFLGQRDRQTDGRAGGRCTDGRAGGRCT